MFFAVLMGLRSDTLPPLAFEEEDRPIKQFQFVSKLGNESLFVHAHYRRGN
jgi:hypothetical protein